MASPRDPIPLTGRHVLIMLLAFFGVMLAVNIYFTVVAVKSFPGEDVPRSYRQGLEYNKTLAARAEQEQSGWTARVNAIQTADKQPQLVLEFKDKDDRSIPGLNIMAKLRHPVATTFDRQLTFIDAGDGRYIANSEPFTGHWTLEAQAQQEDFVFTVRHELWEK
jgi:nitrogen fixation protein FixH